MKKITVIIIAVILLIPYSYSYSEEKQKDEIAKLINNGLKKYKKENFSGAISDLEYAAQLIRQKRCSVLEKILPGPLKGWKADKPKSQSTPAALFGGMTSASRKYTKNSSIVEIQIIADSTLIQSFLSILSNPTIATANGAKLKTIKGQRAIIKQNQTGNIEINIVVANKTLVKIKSTNTSLEETLKYAESINYQKLSNF